MGKLVGRHSEASIRRPDYDYGYYYYYYYHYCYYCYYYYYYHYYYYWKGRLGCWTTSCHRTKGCGGRTPRLNH